MQDIVSFVQIHAHRKREDLAGEVLALLLREVPGQVVIRALLEEASEDVGEIEVMTRKTSVDCVPDIHFIRQGNTIGLLELKFWAPLTTHQLSGQYFKVAPRVTFVVPAKRVHALQIELARLIVTNSLVISSWEDFLGRLDSASGGPSSRDQRLFRGALEHLKEYCNVIEEEHFVPFTFKQLCSPTQDGSTKHLVSLTQKAIAAAIKSELIQGAGRLGAGFDSWFFYGQNVILSGFPVWLGYWPHAWKQSPSKGPLWVQFYGKDATKLLKTGIFGDGLRAMDNDLAFPLLKPAVVAEHSQEEEIIAVITALAELAERLALMLDKTGI